MPKLIPLYDATADIVCTITDAEVSGRVEALEAMRQALANIERTEHGMLLHFAPGADIETEVRQFALDEKRCCEFWGFAVGTDDSHVTLQWDAPPTAMQLIDRLEGFLLGDEPIAALQGLL